MPEVILELAGEHAKLARDLVAGGVFVPGYTLALNEDCELILRGNGAQLHLSARVVWSNGAGIGLQLENCDAAMKQRIAALAAPAGESPASVAAEIVDAASDAGETDVASPSTSPASGEASGEETSDPDDKKRAANLHERLRGLTLAQQVKIAQHGEVSERMLLERMYSKNVWEALLRNQRLTGPEISRIARMGSLPRPLMEIILNNGGWLQIPEVRRALLSNPRLGTDQILRILRLLPKHEVKIAATQTVYPLGVRDAAKRLIKEMGG